MDKFDAYKIVFEDIMKYGPDLFKGIYDAKNGKEEYMYGINSVMEFIAITADEKCYDEFDEMFLKNMIKSKKKALQRSSSMV